MVAMYGWNVGWIMDRSRHGMADEVKLMAVIILLLALAFLLAGVLVPFLQSNMDQSAGVISTVTDAVVNLV